jgi:hypothetical protein
MAAAKKLSARERRYVEERAKGLNGVEAIRAMGFKGRRPDIAASKLSMKPQVAAALEAKLALVAEKVGVTQERWFEEVWDLASAKLPKRKKVTEAGKIRALELAGRHLGAFKDTAGEREVIGPGLTIIIQQGAHAAPTPANAAPVAPGVTLLPGPER